MAADRRHLRHISRRHERGRADRRPRPRAWPPGRGARSRPSGSGCPRPHFLARCAVRRWICCSAVGHSTIPRHLSPWVCPRVCSRPGISIRASSTSCVRSWGTSCAEGEQFRTAGASTIGNIWRAVRFRLRLASSIITVVGNGVKFDLFEEAQQRARPKCPEESLVFRGNLASYQEVDPTLEAFALDRERRPNVRLRIVSQAVFTPFEALARELGVRTRWTWPMAVSKRCLTTSPKPMRRSIPALSRPGSAKDPKLDGDGTADRGFLPGRGGTCSTVRPRFWPRMATSGASRAQSFVYSKVAGCRTGSARTRKGSCVTRTTGRIAVRRWSAGWNASSHRPRRIQRVRETTLWSSEVGAPLSFGGSRPGCSASSRAPRRSAPSARSPDGPTRDQTVVFETCRG